MNLSAVAMLTPTMFTYFQSPLALCFQVLNNLKSQLNTLVVEGSRLRSAIGARTADLDNFEVNYECAQSEQQSAAKIQRRLKLDMEDT
jgi:hypothetical protein